MKHLAKLPSHQDSKSSASHAQSLPERREARLPFRFEHADVPHTVGLLRARSERGPPGSYAPLAIAATTPSSARAGCICATTA